jgi:AcrR family transcriptional regulator
MQAAVEIFWQKGYRVASIQDVADRVGVLKGSLYCYIETKEDLVWRIIEDVREQWSEILRRASTPPRTTRAHPRLHQAARRVVYHQCPRGQRALP